MLNLDFIGTTAVLMVLDIKLVEAQPSGHRVAKAAHVVGRKPCGIAKARTSAPIARKTIGAKQGQIVGLIKGIEFVPAI